MIVNDLENRRTIDDTDGSYLTLVEERPNEDLEFFVIHDGPKKVDFVTELSFVRTSGRLDIMRAVMKSYYLRQNPEDSPKYKKKFQEFIKIYGWCFGLRSERFGESNVDFKKLNT